MHDKTALIPEGSKARGPISSRRWKATALASAAALALLGASLDAQAVALGAVTVRSALGEPLRAEIEVPQISSEEAASFKAALGSRQAFQKAGVEYSQALAGTRVSLQRRANGQAYLRVEGSTPISEPFLSLVIEADWGKGGHVVRDYSVLIDPPARPKPQAQAQPTLPQQAEQVTRPTRQAAGGGARQAAAGGKQPPKPPSAPATPASGGPGGGQVTVTRGETASSILKAHPVDGVSLDQMLVALLRANPHAFINNNVNLMRTGAVLTLPTADQANALSPQAARRNFIAQVHEFNDYRNGVAQNTRKVAKASGQSSTSGKVQNPVVPTPPKPADHVEVSHGGTPDKTVTALVNSREVEEQKARQAEQERNIREAEALRLQMEQAAKASQAKPAAGAGGAATTASTPSQSSVIPPVPVTPPVQEQPKPVEVTPPPAPVPPVVPPSASQPDSAPAAQAQPPEPKPVPPQPQPKPKPVVPPPPRVAPKPAPEPGVMDMLGDNLLTIVIIGVVVVAAIGGLLYSRGRKKKAASLDSSFIESRLQPDSFFGASGGQHVNTRDAAGGAATGNSSLAYSPSQLDAAGDVDPVAEADVYLAYGRDQQAEEILREALRTHQGRVSIHRKLAEIYAKRRDARALQNIATEARSLTHAAGPDWQAIAALGAELDPGNPLYTPAGAPAAPAPAAPAPAAPPPAAPAPAAAAKPLLAEASPRASFSPTPDTILMPLAGNSGAVDLDLGLGEPPAPLAASQPVDLDLGGVNFTPPPAEPQTQPVPMPAAKPAGAATDSRSGGLSSGVVEFDMGSQSPSDSRAVEIDPLQTRQPPGGDDDPIGTKLALAQEFHAIGDDDGARSLIKEVIAEAKGSMKARAERFLAELS
jgi:pilus assembly protein FimV